MSPYVYPENRSEICSAFNSVDNPIELFTVSEPHNLSIGLSEQSIASRS